MTLTVNDLSVDQREAYNSVLSWLGDFGRKPTLSLAGYAGTGKSTVVSVLAHELLKLGPIAFCAFTGKASSVLGRKLRASGIETSPKASRRLTEFSPRPYCGTIHGLIYAPCDRCMVEETFEHTFEKPSCEEPLAKEPHCRRGSWSTVDLSGGVCDGEGLCTCSCAVCKPSEVVVCKGCHPPPPVKVEGSCPKCRDERFIRRSALDRSYRVIIVDEASMVSSEMITDLKSYGVPILAVGDHGQLPPVNGFGSLMVNPELRLEKIHRQAEGNPIIAMSKAIRETGEIDDRLIDGEFIDAINAQKLGRWLAKRFPKERLGLDPTTPEGVLGTVLISWTNKQRCGLNDRVREALGLSGDSPKKGEVMICLKNKAPIYNGMRGVLEYDAELQDGRNPTWKSSVNFVEDSLKGEVKMAQVQFFAEKTLAYEAAREAGISLKSADLYDFAYAVTCHKFQGSQCPEVAVVLDGMRAMDRETKIRWAYTAVTRAESKLLLVR